MAQQKYKLQALTHKTNSNRNYVQT